MVDNYDAAILELSMVWYRFVGYDHHKDRDCHFYIQKEYSYGSDIDYVVYHDGYMKEIEPGEFKTVKEAETYLIKQLISIIEEQIEYARSVPKEEVEENLRNYEAFEYILSEEVGDIINKYK